MEELNTSREIEEESPSKRPKRKQTEKKLRFGITLLFTHIKMGRQVHNVSIVKKNMLLIVQKMGFLLLIII